MTAALLTVAAASAFSRSHVGQQLPTMPRARASPPFSTATLPQISTEESYAAQFDRVFSQAGETPEATKPLPGVSKPLPKPTPAAQAAAPGATRIPFSDVFATRVPKAWQSIHPGRATYMLWAHSCFVAAFACFFSWENLAWHFLFYCMSGLGITYSFHRQLTHKSFQTPKWLEYIGACEKARAASTSLSTSFSITLATSYLPLDPSASALCCRRRLCFCLCR